MATQETNCEGTGKKIWFDSSFAFGVQTMLCNYQNYMQFYVKLHHIQIEFISVKFPFFSNCAKKMMPGEECLWTSEAHVLFYFGMWHSIQQHQRHQSRQLMINLCSCINIPSSALGWILQFENLYVTLIIRPELIPDCIYRFRNAFFTPC